MGLGARVDPDGACNLCFAAPFRIEWCFHMLYLVLMHRTTNMTRTLTNRPQPITPQVAARYWHATRARDRRADGTLDRKSTRLNSSHTVISYAVFCLKKK